MREEGVRGGEGGKGRVCAGRGKESAGGWGKGARKGGGRKKEDGGGEGVREGGRGGRGAGWGGRGGAYSLNYRSEMRAMAATPFGGAGEAGGEVWRV